MNNFNVKVVNTEKAYKLREGGIYVFLYPVDCRKCDIKCDVEKRYSVKVENIRTLVLPKKLKVFRGNVGVLSNHKKVYVKLMKGMKIDIDGDSIKKE